MTDRLLLCRPQGGLNDLLCQVERACLYGKKFGRTVIIDTNYSNSIFFRDDFSKYFASTDRSILLSLSEAPGCLDETDVFPVFVKGRLRSYTTRYDNKVWGAWVDTEVGAPIGFDFETDYPHRLLVHQNDGGGALSIGALARLRLQEPLREALARRRALAGPSYSAVHVRHTDYKGGYERLTRALIDPVDPLFVASDHPEPVAYFQNLIGADRVLSFSKIPDWGGWPIHASFDPSEAFERNADAILDLLMLALATRFYVLELKPNVNNARFSGFSMLADNLRKAPDVLARLIAPHETAPPKTYSMGFSVKLPYRR